MPPCGATVPNKSASGDNYYGGFICWEPYVDYFWDAYGFQGNKSDWDGGFGWEDCCNTDLPLARTFNACYLLTYSAADYGNDSYSSPCLNWARRYVREHIDDLLAACGDGSAIARSYSGCGVDDRVVLYRGYWYSKDVPGRAETLLHEARHQGGKPHNANFRPGRLMEPATRALTRVGAMPGRGCMRRCIYGGSMPPARTPPLPCESWRACAATS